MKKKTVVIIIGITLITACIALIAKKNNEICEDDDSGVEADKIFGLDKKEADRAFSEKIDDAE